MKNLQHDLLVCQHKTKDDNIVHSKVFQLQGFGEQYKCPKSIMQKADCFILGIGGHCPSVANQNFFSLEEDPLA